MRRRTIQKFKERVGLIFFIIFALCAFVYIALLIYDVFTSYQIPK